MDDRDLLTYRQRQVMELIAEGYTNAQIATRLGIKEYTVKNHLDAVRIKLMASTRAHLVAILFRKGQLI